MQRKKVKHILDLCLAITFFDNDHDLDDKVEGGFRLGHFLTESISIEGEVDYTNTDHDTKGDTSATSLSLVGVKFFDLSSYYKPFIFGGLGGLIAEETWDHSLQVSVQELLQTKRSALISE